MSVFLILASIWRAFDLYGEDDDAARRAKMLEIWTAIPEAMRLVGLMSLASGRSPLRYLAAAVAGVGDAKGAGAKALQEVRRADFNGNPVPFGWLAFLSCETESQALEHGLSLFDAPQRHTKIAGHVILVCTTLWPVSPHPREIEFPRLPEPPEAGAWHPLRAVG